MTRSAAGLSPPPRLSRHPKAQSASDSPRSDAESIYGRPFWYAYAANAVFLVAVALLFRYADFITLLGGTEFHLGWIVGVGLAGSFVTRLTIGSWIDRYGSRPLWIGSLLLFSVTCLAHLMVLSHAGLSVYLLRISYCCAVAGINGASMTFASGRGPTARIAELVGMLGTAGFLGSVLGTQLGDLLLGGSTAIGRPQIVEMFVVAAGLAILAIPLAWIATRGEFGGRRHVGPGWTDIPLVPSVGGDSCRRSCDETPEIRRQESPPTTQTPPCRMGTSSAPPSLPAILRRHNPGLVLIVGVAMGVALGLPATFLRPFAAELDIPRIGLFFMVYAVTAIITRVVTRRWAERFGPRPIIIVGLAGLAASLVLFLLVGKEWQLALPAIGFGCSHAVLFPSVVAEGSGAFPVANRGMATLLMLATWDLGMLIGAPLAGATLRIARLGGLPPYPTMYLTVAGLTAAVCLWYAAGVLWSRRPAAASIEGQFGRLPPKKYQLPALPLSEESVDISGNSRSNILIEASGPAVVGQNVPVPSPAGGGMD